MLLAQVHVALGEPGDALDLLEQALAGRAADLPLLTLRPSFDPLFSLPRFDAIVEALEG